MKVIFIIAGLQTYCIPLMFVIVWALQTDDVIMDLGWGGLAAAVVHHSMVDGEVSIQVSVLNASHAATTWRPSSDSRRELCQTEGFTMWKLCADPSRRPCVDHPDITSQPKLGDSSAST
jgi:hypothetical protein